MGKKLYVGNMGYEVGSSDLQQLFTPYGEVQSAEVINDRTTGRSKGFGFVEMGSDQEAQAAIAALNGKDQNGRALTVNEAKPRGPRSGGSGGRSDSPGSAAAPPESRPPPVCRRSPDPLVHVAAGTWLSD